MLTTHIRAVALHTPGHTDGHYAFYLFSNHGVKPRLSITKAPMSRANNLSQDSHDSSDSDSSITPSNVEGTQDDVKIDVCDGLSAPGDEHNGTTAEKGEGEVEELLSPSGWADRVVAQWRTCGRCRYAETHPCCFGFHIQLWLLCWFTEQGQQGCLFTGDCLFVGGIGALFDGDEEQWWNGIQQVAIVPVMPGVLPSTC